MSRLLGWDPVIGLMPGPEKAPGEGGGRSDQEEGSSGKGLVEKEMRKSPVRKV